MNLFSASTAVMDAVWVAARGKEVEEDSLVTKLTEKMSEVSKIKRQEEDPIPVEDK